MVSLEMPDAAHSGTPEVWHLEAHGETSLEYLVESDARREHITDPRNASLAVA